MRLVDADILIQMISDEMITDAKALNIFRNLGDIDKVETLNMACERHIQMIEQLSTIDTEPVRHGKWIVDEDGNIECSECGCHGIGDNYCERCGAKMDGVKERLAMPKADGSTLSKDYMAR